MESQKFLSNLESIHVLIILESGPVCYQTLPYHTYNLPLINFRSTSHQIGFLIFPVTAMRSNRLDAYCFSFSFSSSES